MGVNVWLRQGGYLFLAPTADQARRLEANVLLHERHGLRTRVISPGEAGDLVPEPNPNLVDLCSQHVERLRPPVGWRVLDERAPVPTAHP